MFREMKIYKDNGYPAVYWLNHPVARTNGSSRIHRIIAFEKFGTVALIKHVHHIDGNRWNWHPDNLELLTNSEHGIKHALERGSIVFISCKYCELIFKASKSDKRKFCSRKCSAKFLERTIWPELNILVKMVEDTNFRAVGKKLGVSGAAVHKRIKRH